MNRTSALLLATAALAMSAAPAALAVAPPALPARPRSPRREVATQPESPRQAMRREIAEHNAAVDARRAEKRARRFPK